MRGYNSLSLQHQIDLLRILNRIDVAQGIVNTCCDFTAQCIIVRINHSSSICHLFYSDKSSKIYRCWIVWGKKMRIVIIPSFLAITLLGQSIYLHLISRLPSFNLLPPVTWLVPVAVFSGNANTNDPVSYWPNTLYTTGLAASMAVNTLVTGMIVFRILQATGVKPTSVERTLGSTEGNKFRHIIFIIIESGMALFAIQLVRIVTSFMSADQEPFLEVVEDLVITINQMLNVIIIRSSFLPFLFC